MPIGQAYSESLTPREQQALADGCTLLIDGIFDDLALVQEPGDVAQTTLVEHLPTRYLPRYTPLFCRKFAICIITVAWKLAQPDQLPLSSVAEELAAWTIINEAKSLIAEREGETAAEQAFDTFVEEYFEDTDVLFLFDDAYDGIDEGVVGQLVGMSSLAFDAWFRPFSNDPARTAHPYVLSDALQGA